MTPTLEGYYTVVEAAEELGISRRGVQKHIDRGNVHPVKVGSTWLIPAAELEKIRDLKPGPKPQQNT